MATHTLPDLCVNSPPASLQPPYPAPSLRTNSEPTSQNEISQQERGVSQALRFPFRQPQLRVCPFRKFANLTSVTPPHAQTHFQIASRFSLRRINAIACNKPNLSPVMSLACGIPLIYHKERQMQH